MAENQCAVLSMKGPITTIRTLHVRMTLLYIIICVRERESLYVAVNIVEVIITKRC